jgi:penicillin-binding protein 1C
LRRWLPKLFAVAGVGLVAALLVGFALFAWYSRNLPDPSNLSHRATDATTRIYDRTGEKLLYQIHGDQKRTPVTLASLPDSVKNATIVAEDREFYHHGGFDIRGILRAAFLNVFGSGTQGGSTLTQQLVKNTIVGGEKKYARKIKEVILSHRIEQQFSKDQILEMYLNSVPYGGSAYGVEAAAGRYFGKSSHDLTLAESAVLAALLKAPSSLSPYGGNKDALINRQRYILGEMKKLGYITADQQKTAEAEQLNFVPLRDAILAPHFVFYIQSLLAQKYGEQYVETGGLKIVTTLDARLQQIAEDEVRKGADRNAKQYGGKNAALVALDPKTGQILSMVGSKDYFDESIDGNVNVTLQPRQPGSSFKPIVYATAFMRGFTPSTILYDVATTFAGGPKPYQPSNYDGKEHGPLTIRQALSGSLNIPAVKMLYMTGIDNVLNEAERLGYTTLSDRSRFGLSLVLGGGEVKLLEHVAAFQSFANDGAYNPPTGILRVEDANGAVLESFEPKSAQALPTEVARQITSVLSDNGARTFIFGPSSPLTFGDRPIAAKTGTTNDFHDGWTIGYTPSLIAGVWAGNNNNTAMHGGSDGVVVAAPIWHAFMQGALSGTPAEAFPAPQPPKQEGNPALYGETPNTVSVVIDKASGKLATDLTPVAYRETKTFHQVHSELFYIDPANPTGPAPEHPEQDTNFASWEAGVRTWAAAHGEELGATAPTEYDDVHTVENQPKLIMTSPAPGQTVRGTTLTLSAIATAPRQLKGIHFYLDGTLLTTSDGSSTITTPVPAGTTTGFHVLKAEAFDDIGNTKTIERTFNYIP